jgi:hypothetical protein
MTRRSATIVRLFGVILILLVSAWDVDAMRAHIAAHSWTTLAFVSLFLAAHLSDYLTVGRIVNRFDPLAFASENEIAVATVAYDERQPSVQTSSTAELYVFTVVTTTQAQASGAPYAVTSQSITVQSEQRNAPAHPASFPSETRNAASTGTGSVLPWKKMRSDALPS